MRIERETKNGSPRHPSRLPAWLGMFVVAIALGGCEPQEGDYGAIASGPENLVSSGGECHDATCHDVCSQGPAPGCPCETDGARLRCPAKATFTKEGTSPGATWCEPGWSICAEGIWGHCFLSGV
jgi:hypothetical protein